MNTNSLILKSSLLITGLLLASGCAEFNDPYYPSRDGYYDSYDRGDYYNDRERDRLRHERRELDRERDRLEDQRRHEERERREREAYRPPPPPPPSQDRCPSGFSPSEQKCSPDERRHGCKDIRLPSGLGCVRR